MYELPVKSVESRDSVEYISPKIKIIPLMDDPVIFPKGQFGTSIHGRAGKLLEHHHHGPLDKNHILFHHNRFNFHIQLFGAFRKPVAHRGEVFNPFDPLDAVLEYNILMVIWKDVRPVRFAIRIIGLPPKLTDLFGS